jgi:hypothetical protein
MGDWKELPHRIMSSFVLLHPAVRIGSASAKEASVDAQRLRIVR